MRKTFTIEDIRSWKPCYDPANYLPENWVGTAIDILRHNSIPASHKMWVVLREKLIDAKTLRLFAVWCARGVEHWLTDERSKNAITLAEKFANGIASLNELDAAWDAASDAASAAAWEAASAAASAAASDAASAAASDAASAAAWEAASAAAWAAARAAAWAAASDARAAARAAASAAASAARADAQAAQINQLIKMITEQQVTNA